MADLPSIIRALGVDAHQLHPPASSDALQLLATLHEGKLQPELSAAYRAFDGERALDGIFCGYVFLPVSGVVREMKTWQMAREDRSLAESPEDSIPSHPPGAIKGLTDSKHWIPFATAYGGAALAVDLDPGPTGNVGQIINFGPDDFEHFRLAGSFAEFLETVLQKYREQRWHPRFEGDDWSLYEELRAARSGLSA